ncbi:MAG: hypothetical protein P0Y53_05440 [Candidatus Pseudobacter hemicellulosilyticus]|uniref:Tetratricopeptide repeat protein n=1 Tax=Candidatus Pseudobacter hemicellulosilyticus TaxID=3121375 RepID=A0AAJ5WT88_9BACT|nr:MAG: hypothetical protein P0Y53_05440 [Pseudobacter sp.]
MIRALALGSLMLFLFSCATYNTRIGQYYSVMRANEFQKADAALDQARILGNKRNRLLYLLEKGKMTHLLRQYDSSNTYFNEADLFMEDVRTTAGDVAVGMLLNPMMQTYKGESFERFMVHYYKALNYLYLGKTDEALVEARRISLQSYALQDQSKRENRYSDDAFSLMLQGIIYEKGGDINNAFISYRNAVDIYLKNNNSYYGVQLPQQLKLDLVRTAALNGFRDEQERYEKLLNVQYKPVPPGEGGDLILFWENGLAPVKQEQNFFFSLTKDGAGNFAFVDPSGSFNIPFNFAAHNLKDDDVKLGDLRSLRVAFPRYQEQPGVYRKAVLNLNNHTYNFETAEDINALAFATLRERFLKEMATTLARLAVKKLAEAAVRPKEDDKNKDTREAIALAMQVFNFVTEKADTRNWQSLPHTIYYTRVPLDRGTNVLQVNISGQGSETVNLVAEGNGRLQVLNLCTLR